MPTLQINPPKNIIPAGGAVHTLLMRLQHTHTTPQRGAAHHQLNAQPAIRVTKQTLLGGIKCTKRKAISLTLSVSEQLKKP